MDVDIDTAVVASEANQLAEIATSIERATTTAASGLSGLAGMAGIDPMAEDWANGTVDSGGYDAIAQGAIDGGTTLAQAIAGFEGHVLAVAAGYRAMEVAGAEPGTPNPYTSMTPTTIAGQCWSLGTALGDEQRGTALGDVRQWVEDTLRDTAGIVFPTADTDKVSRAQGIWDQYASDLNDAAAALSASLPATLAFEFPQRASVIAAQTRLARLISDAATDATSIAEYCGSYATNVSDIRSELESMMGQLLTEIAIDLAITGVLAVLTAGIGAIAGSAKAAATIVKWAVRINNVILRLRALVTSSKAAVRIGSRIGIEALRSTVSGTMANAGASLMYGDFSWSGLGTAAITSGVGGGFAGPFSHIGTQSASRVTRISTQAGVGGITGAGGGVAGEWVASEITGSDFNLIMAAVTGGIGGTAGGGIGGIGGPSSGGGTSPFAIAPKPTPAGTTPGSNGSATPGVSTGSTSNAAPPVVSTAGSSATTTAPGGAAPRVDSTAPTPGAAGSGGAATSTAGGSGSATNPSAAPTPTGGGGGGNSTGAAGNSGAVPAGDAPHVPTELPASGPEPTAGGTERSVTPAEPTPTHAETAPARGETPAQTHEDPVVTPSETSAARQSPTSNDTGSAARPAEDAGHSSSPESRGDHSDPQPDGRAPDGPPGESVPDSSAADGSDPDAPSNETAGTPPPGDNAPGDGGTPHDPPRNEPAWVHHPSSLAPPRQELTHILDGDASAGPGWHRYDDAHRQESAAYPGPRPRAGLLDGDFGPEINDAGHASRTGPAADLLNADPEAPWGHRPDGTPYADGAEWSRDNVDFVHGQTYGDLHWAPNDGAVFGTRIRITDLEVFDSLAGNLHIDRLGGTSGSYLGIGGGTFGERALPPGQLTQSDFWHISLRPDAVLPDGWALEISRVAPAYGQPGGGLQLVVRDQHGEGLRLDQLSQFFTWEGHEFS